MTDNQESSSTSSPEAQANQWAMFVHLSLLASTVIPVLGIVLPIVLWQVKKDEMPEIDVHGKIVLNWIISSFIYAVVGVALTLIIVGFFILLALYILNVVFPIVGGIKANNGEVWRYPLSIPFLKVD